MSSSCEPKDSRPGREVDPPARPAGNRRIRVLHLIKGLGLGGAEQLINLLVRVGDRERFEYSVAYAVDRLDDLVGPLREAGVCVYPLGAETHLDLRWALRLRQLLAEKRFDVVHLHLPYTAAVGRVVAWSLGRHRPRLVHTQHNIWHHTELPTRMMSAATWWMDDADIVVSDAAYDALPKMFARRSEVLVHGIDTASAPPACSSESVRREFGVDSSDVMVVTVANMRKEKGYEVLLAAAKELVDEQLPIRFVAVGHGPLEAEVREECRRLQLGGRFVFAGLRRDVDRILAGADVFVLTSHHEGFPVSLMEALAAGLPVVATRAGDIPKAVRDGIDGIIVPTGDSKAVAAALRAIVTDEALRSRLTVAARDGAARFDIHRAARRIEEIYGEVLAGR